MSDVSPVIAVVDDDESVRNALGRLIRSVGLNVQTFASARDYLDYDHPHPPACLVLDVLMPGLDGLELQEMLVAAGSQTPIVFITAHEDAQARARAMKAGASDFLLKPFDEHTLLDAINRTLDQ